MCYKWSQGSNIVREGEKEPSLCSKFPPLRKVSFPEFFERKGFRAETLTIDDRNNVELPLNLRRGIGNYTILRPGFEQFAPYPRQAPDFEKLQALDIAQSGIKVQLSDDNLAKIFKVALPDPTDVNWIVEKERLVTLYKGQGKTDKEIEQLLTINKPLNRDQRTITKMENITTTAISLSNKISELHEEVKQGRAEGVRGRKVIFDRLLALAKDTESLSNLSEQKLNAIGELLLKIQLPNDYKSFGITSRIIDAEYYFLNSGVINLLILNNVMYNRRKGGKIDFNNPIKGVGGKYIKLNSMESLLQYTDARRQFLDLQEFEMIKPDELATIINNTPQGADNTDMFSLNADSRNIILAATPATP